MKVYALNVSKINSGNKELYKYLSKKRIEKVNRLKKDKNRAQSIGAELLLNYAVNGNVKKSAAWDTDANGKPYLTECKGLYVNLSHSGDYAVCALCDTPVGVDIQRRGECDIKIAERFFTAQEVKFINGSNDKNEAFFEIWTKKESFVKAVGKGLSIPFGSFSALADTVEYEGKLYKFRQFSIKDSDYTIFACYLS